MVSLTSDGRRSAASTLTTIGPGVIDSSAKKFFYRISQARVSGIASLR